MKLKTSYLFVFIALVMSCCTKDNDPTIARVANHRIKLSEFSDYMKNNKSSIDLATASESVLKRGLEELITRQLRLQYAYQNNYHERSDIVEKVDRDTERIVYSTYMEKEITDKLISEEELLAHWKQNVLQLKARHILLKTEKGADEEEVKSVQNRANALYQRLLRGEKFERLAEQYSDEKSSGELGGDLGFFKWGGLGYSDEFYHIAFDMEVGDISEPVRTDQGFHIIRVDNKRSGGLGNYEKAIPNLKNQLIRSKQAEGNQKYHELCDELKRNYASELDTSVIEYMAGLVLEALEDTTVAPAMRDHFAKITDEDSERIIATYRGGDVKIGDVVSFLKPYPTRNRPRLDNAYDAMKFAGQLMTISLVIKDAERKGYDGLQSVVERKKSRTEQYVLQAVIKETVKDKVNPSSDDYREFYEQNKSKFVTTKRMKVQEIFISDKTKAEQILKRARAGENFSRLARTYTERNAQKDDDGILGYIQQHQYGPIGKEAVRLNIGEISDLIKVGAKHSIIKVLDIEKPRVKTFEEAKGELTVAYNLEEENRLEKEFIEEMRKKTYVVTLDDVLINSLQELEEE